MVLEESKAVLAMMAKEWEACMTEVFLHNIMCELSDEVWLGNYHYC